MVISEKVSTKRNFLWEKKGLDLVYNIVNLHPQRDTEYEKLPDLLESADQELYSSNVYPDQHEQAALQSASFSLSPSED